MHPPGKRTGRHAMLHAFYHLSFHRVALERPVSANKKDQTTPGDQIAPGEVWSCLHYQSQAVSTLNCSQNSTGGKALSIKKQGRKKLWKFCRKCSENLMKYADPDGGWAGISVRIPPH